jgi:inhibitor of cysteine peptidase
MKRKLIIGMLVGILALSLPACATSAKKVTVQLSYDEFVQNKNLAREINAGAGDVIEVTVASNPTTGFKWELAGISDPAILVQDGESEYVPPESTLAGAGGQEVWTFKVLKKGKANISLKYSRPWEGGEKAEWTLEIYVTVK